MKLCLIHMELGIMQICLRKLYKSAPFYNLNMKTEQSKTTIILMVLLVIVVGYVVVDKLIGYVGDKFDGIRDDGFQKGYNEGLTTAAVALIQQTQNCNPTAITLQNFTRYLVDVGCVVPQQQQP